MFWVVIKKPLSVSFGYKKTKYGDTYDIYVRQPILIRAVKLLKSRPHVKVSSGYNAGSDSFYLIDGCIVCVSPKTTYKGTSTRWDYSSPSEIELIGEPKNSDNLSGLLKKLKLPLDSLLKRGY